MMEKSIPRTFGDAKKAGYKCGRTALQRGYVSRKSVIDELPVEVAGGNIKGELYVTLPNWKSTMYCIRQYLI